MYTIYTHPFSQHSRRVVALLESTGLAYEAKFVDLAAAEHLSPHYLAINPNHQVPTLVDGDMRLHESGAILRWLCTKHDLSDWYPVQLSERAQVEQWLEWTQSRLQTPVVQIVFNTVFAGEHADRTAIEQGRKSMIELSEILEASLEGRDWIAGGHHPTIADLALGTNITHLDLAGAQPQTTNIQAWIKRVMALPGFAKAMPPAMAEA